MWKRDLGWVAVCFACTACSSSGGDDDSSAGSSGNGGSSTNGGSGGSSANGGSGGSSGSQGGSSGSNGGSSHASDIPQPTGTVGSGVHQCSDPNVTNFMCAPGSVCCVDDSADQDMCVSSFAACTCAANGNCTAEGCYKDAECGAGLVCCGLRNGASEISPLFVATECKASCDGGDWKICDTDADCPSPKTCHAASFNYGYCR